MRAVIQGIDARQAWSRYMQGEEDRVDGRLIRRVINTFRDELAAAARRHARPGTARLVLMDASRLPDAAVARPSLEDFALAQGLEDFSHEDQLAAFEEAWGTEADEHRRQSKRRRLVDRQLAALSWLEGLSARSPRADDPVEDWLAPALAKRISDAGMPTLRSVVSRIQAVGTRWWAGVPAVGPTKAARVVEWLRVHQEETGLPLGPHAFSPISRVGRELLDPLVEPATALRPLEKFVVPEALCGRGGRFRAPAANCQIDAQDDRQAVERWLDRRGRAAAPSEDTRRAYRKEVERLLLWAVLERGKALSALEGADCVAFIDFLRSPPAAWCGPRHHERWSPLWRPLEGPLGPAALRRCIAVLRSLFGFLHGCGYLTHDPASGLGLPEETNRARALEPAADASTLLDIHQAASVPATPGLVRARRVAAWLRGTGIKPGALARARCADLLPPDASRAGGAAWRLRVPQRGRAQPDMLEVPDELIAQLRLMLGAWGHPADPAHDANANIPLVMDERDGRVTGLSRGGVYKAVRRLLQHCSIGRSGPERRVLLGATPQRLARGRGRRYPAV